MDPDFSVTNPENIDWDATDEDTANALKALKPKSKYGFFSNKIRGTISEEKMCSMFCGGQKCKYESDTFWKEDEMAITGLFSHWVTENILAMARPNSTNMQKHDLLEKFNDAGIKSIINLQKPGEHASCGYGLHSLGFSYDPQEFMDKGIFFYNFGWKDYGVASMSTILDMVKVMQFAVSQGKVSIHCHAGLGRTGVLIACFLVFNNRIEADEAIQFVRLKRPNAIQTSGQIKCIQEFADYLVPRRIIYATLGSEATEFTLAKYLVRQKQMLHGYEARKLKHIPKPIYVLCERLLELANKRKRHLEEACTKTHHIENLDVIKETASEAFVNERDTKLQANNSDNSLDASLECSSSQSDENRSGSLSPTSGAESLSNEPQEEGSVTKVVDAMTVAEHQQTDVTSSEEYQHQLNTVDTGWENVYKESNPYVLGHMLWSWIDHLKEPILRIQDLKLMLQYVEEPLKGLTTLEKGPKHTLEYLAKVVTRLRPLNEEQERNLLQHLISGLTHQPVIMETDISDLHHQTLRRSLSTVSSFSSFASLNEIGESSVPKIVQYFWNLLDAVQTESESTGENDQRRSDLENMGKTKFDI
ncbi:protein tyrosine phosphatase domain-containing protein 1 isoform X1 [Lingula anatina]|uniref:Protein tyrosine phosphatase domain-containing protein 1 n=1 Tax=Lingula anatina TaxID=7574 RepID=A0A1S3J883_LINAN|nr:protein tyrosine phosphatase domain-containing protein 1 isoform X1 [Lingula anatina]|eukprot:XP_013406069.1 protein tyrosine phosphatase domain-containing protein 1 isoform X1 [Lingula anatina]